eukprot:CAMPEP_0198729090 /NCGR_PEP_ID=MMETSP1475-20131203/14770_1 /TAXON_ID= ORGANISM="Unidentified sp., Strain CCMP1999" /NCGR_SAMPLE_ID=MMETSP1475 /ASSEMBLY_ACC=CAM_ASM_001111 /LENGTH=74 /DNA_ID=CAMNT_0044491655 /DNA_START=670 /DNA_END=894 /DNA_ORIENTATION=+
MTSPVQKLVRCCPCLGYAACILQTHAVRDTGDAPFICSHKFGITTSFEKGHDSVTLLESLGCIIANGLDLSSAL